MKKVILIVDDDPDIRNTLKDRLEFHGFYRCICVAGAKSALNTLKSRRCDLILLDLGLKRIDGTAVLENVTRVLPKGVHTPPVVILSGHNEKEIIDYCLEKGASGFIAKPANLDVLVSMVSEYA